MALPKLCFASQENKYDVHRAIEQFSEQGYEVVQIVEDEKYRNGYPTVQIIFRLNIPYYMAIQEEKLLPTPEGIKSMPISFKEVDFTNLDFKV